MKDFNIKIAGNGIREEIINSLQNIINDLNNMDENDSTYSSEDGCLYIEMNED